MGAYTQEVRTVLQALEKRFASPEAIDEMAALQREFHIFDRKKHLRSSFAEINVDGDWPCHLGWHRYLSKMPQYGSDIPGMNGHDRVVDALKTNLESATALPMAFRTHQAEEDPRVAVVIRDGTLVVSMPVCPPAVAATRKAA